MPDSDMETPAALTIDLPVAYSHGGFVQVRRVILQPETPIAPNAPAANDDEPASSLLSAY